MDNVERLIFHFFAHTPTEDQRRACRNMISFLYARDANSLFMLKGYAGTGKTSLVSALIKAAPYMKIRTVLLAPTGRAAKVLSGDSETTAHTIHKKIYSVVEDASGGRHFVRTQNKHSYTLFIVDEASMIGTGHDDAFLFSRRSLLEDLLDYVNSGNHCRLFFIGDEAQLPPVGASESPALSADYLNYVCDMKVHESQLKEVVRQDHLSGILLCATELRRSLSSMADFDEVILPLFSLSGIHDVVRLGGADLIEVLNREYSDHDISDVVFICRTNRRANLYNQSIRSRVLFRDDEIGTGDYMMVVKNNYFWLDESDDMSFVANGDIVEIMSARNFEEMYGFHFADVTVRFVDYPNAPTLDCKILLEVLHSESSSLTADESQRLYDSVMEDYADIPNRTERLEAMRKNPYYNALQVKFAYALTCHKTQGGQWPVVFI